MRYLALACDYDGTLTVNSHVERAALSALERIKRSGRRLILLTGRLLDDLSLAFPHLDLFDCVVAENGAVFYRPSDRERKVLGGRPPERFVTMLHDRGVPLTVGQVIVATVEPYETTVLTAIRDLGLELQVIFNKGGVMVLPSGLNKATGLQVALDALGLSPHNVVGVGDAENDHAFLSLCECSVAVANALPELKERADCVTQSADGAGVIELVERLLDTDLQELAPQLARHDILIGHRQPGGEDATLSAYGGGFLLTGPSGSGKSTLATAMIERLVEKAYQVCIIDPEGDYQSLDGAVVLGTPRRAPSVAEILDLLAEPDQNCVANLLGIRLEARPQFFDSLLPRLQELRMQTGRPHWIVVDEAHHLMPSTWDPARLSLPPSLSGMILITVHPESVAQAALKSIDAAIAVGASPEKTIEAVTRIVKGESHHLDPVELEAGEALAWLRQGAAPFRLSIAPPRTERLRHRRKYAEGSLGEDKSFYFRGPSEVLNLRAQNLTLFMQMADGVDDETWRYHLRQGDYSRWFQSAIKDDELADAARRIEMLPDLSPKESRAMIRAAIEERYTMPP